MTRGENFRSSLTKYKRSNIVKSIALTLGLSWQQIATALIVNPGTLGVEIGIGLEKRSCTVIPRSIQPGYARIRKADEATCPLEFSPTSFQIFPERKERAIEK